MTVNITFVSFSEEEGFDGKKNFVFTTANGTPLKCYDLQTAQDIMMNMKTPLEVELVTSKNGKEYIKRILGVAAPQIKRHSTVTQTTQTMPTTNFNGQMQAPLSMWVSYAKDVFGMLMLREQKANQFDTYEVMKDACRLVKLARTELSQ